MKKRLQVKNLAVTIDDARLEAIFAAFGQVASANVVVDQYNGISRGFGYVEMTKTEDADKCIESLSGQDYEGRVIEITEAPPKPKGRARK